MEIKYKIIKQLKQKNWSGIGSKFLSQISFSCCLQFPGVKKLFLKDEMLQIQVNNPKVFDSKHALVYFILEVESIRTHFSELLMGIFISVDFKVL